jgi:ADP-heptose:LPS heptosyltransferase
VLVQRFLIIRFSSIGDIVLTSPIVRCLAAKYPEAEIHYLSKPAFSGILESNPHISKVWMWNEDSKELISELGSMQFDYIIDLHHNLRSFLVKSKLNRKSASFNKLNIEKYLYVNFRIGKLPDVHTACDLIAAFYILHREEDIVLAAHVVEAGVHRRTVSRCRLHGLGHDSWNV